MSVFLVELHRTFKVLFYLKLTLITLFIETFEMEEKHATVMSP